MNFKVFGVCLVVVACSGLGFKKASDIGYEIRMIHDLINILNYMECELHCRLTPLPELCRISAKQGKSLLKLFLNFANELETQISPDAACCMDSVIRKCAFPLVSVETLLRELGASFGKFDLNGQLNGIEIVRIKSENQLKMLENNKETRIRNYQTLGICAGVALAILLI